jgi:hypothetical protein
MPIQVICPSCNTKLKVPDQMAGKVGKCPNCQQHIQLPAAPAASPPAIPRVPALGPLPSAGAGAPMARAPVLDPSPPVGAPPPIPAQALEFPWLAGGQGQYAPAQGQYAPVRSPVASGNRWPIVRVGLAAAEGGTLVGAASAFCTAAVFALILSLGSGPHEPSVAMQRLVLLLATLGMAGTYSTWIVMLTSWSVCLAGAERALKGTVATAVAAMCGALLLLLAMIAFTPLRNALAERPVGALSESAAWMRLLVCLLMVAVGVAYAVFAAFLQGVADRTGNRSLGAQTLYHIIYVVVLGGWLVLSVLIVSAAEHSRTIEEIFPYNVVATLAAMIFHFLWLRSLSSQARRALRCVS